MIQPGDIGVSKSRGDFISNAMSSFMRAWCSHTFLGAYEWRDLEMVFEANYNIMLTPFDRNYRQNADMKYRIYRRKEVVDSPQALKVQEDILKKFVNEKSNIGYAVFQLPWFIWLWFRSIRWINKLGIPPIDTLKERNWSSKGLECAGVVFLYDEAMGYKDFVKFLFNTIHAGNVCDFVETTKLYYLAESKDFDEAPKYFNQDGNEIT